jgi:hypothetical protein
MIDGRGRRNDEIWALDHYFKKTSKPKYESPPQSAHHLCTGFIFYPL